MHPDLEATLFFAKDDSQDSREIPLSSRDILIGRAAECDIQLDDTQVSRFHASLKAGTQGFWLTDMDSTNGTLVDERPIPPNRRIEIHPHQKFRIGSYVFRLRVPGVEAAPEPAKTDETVQATMMMPGVALPRSYDLKMLRETEFPQMLGRTHLDNAEAAPIPQRTLKKMDELLREQLADTRWSRGNFAPGSLDLFMEAVAKFVNAALPGEIFPVGGAAAGLNLVAQSIPLHPGDNIVLCELEYPANALPWMSLRGDGAETKLVPAVDGGLTLESIREAVDEHTRAVAVSAVQFLTGHRTDLAGIGAFCQDRDIIFVVDADACIAHIPIDVRAQNVDILAAGGHRSMMAGPGVGFLYVGAGVAARLRPDALAAMSSMRQHDSPTGSPNVLGLAAMVESITLIEELTRGAIDRHTTNLAAHALATARARGYELVTALGEHGAIAVFRSRMGSALTREFLGKIEADDKIALGAVPDREGNLQLRLSFHCYNEESDITRAFDALDHLL